MDTNNMSGKKGQAIPEVSGMWMALVFIVVVFMIILGAFAAFPGISDWFSDFFGVQNATTSDYKIALDSTEALQCAINSVAIGGEWNSCLSKFSSSGGGISGFAAAGGTYIEDGVVKNGATITCDSKASKCTIKNFQLPQDVTWSQRVDYLGAFGHPEFLVYWQSFPMDADTWSTDDGWKLEATIIILAALPVTKILRFGGKWVGGIFRNVLKIGASKAAIQVFGRELTEAAAREGAERVTSAFLKESFEYLSKESAEAIAERGVKEVIESATQGTLKGMSKSAKKRLIADLTTDKVFAEQVAREGFERVLPRLLKESGEKAIKAFFEAFKHPIKLGKKILIRGVVGGVVYIALDRLIFYHNILRLLNKYPNKLVLKEPYQNEDQLDLVESIKNNPVVSDLGDALQLASLASPCAIESVDIEMGQVSCKQYSYTIDGIVGCLELDEPGNVIAPCISLDVGKEMERVTEMANGIAISTPSEDSKPSEQMRDFENVPLTDNIKFSFYPYEPEKSKLIFSSNGETVTIEGEPKTEFEEGDYYKEPYGEIKELIGMVGIFNEAKDLITEECRKIDPLAWAVINYMTEIEYEEDAKELLIIGSKIPAKNLIFWFDGSVWHWKSDELAEYLKDDYYKSYHPVGYTDIITESTMPFDVEIKLDPAVSDIYSELSKDNNRGSLENGIKIIQDTFNNKEGDYGDDELIIHHYGSDVTIPKTVQLTDLEQRVKSSAREYRCKKPNENFIASPSIEIENYNELGGYSYEFLAKNKCKAEHPDKEITKVQRMSTFSYSCIGSEITTTRQLVTFKYDDAVVAELRAVCSFVEGKCENAIELMYRPYWDGNIWQHIAELSDKIIKDAETYRGTYDEISHNVPIRVNTLSAIEDLENNENMAGVAIFPYWIHPDWWKTPCSNNEMFDLSSFPEAGIPCVYYKLDIFTDRDGDNKIDHVFLGSFPEEEWNIDIGFSSFRDDAIQYTFVDTDYNSVFDLYTAGQNTIGSGSMTYQYGKACIVDAVKIVNAKRSSEIEPNYCFHKESALWKAIGRTAYLVAIGGMVVGGFVTGGMTWIGAAALGAVVLGTAAEVTAVYEQHKQRWPGD